jgi:hypothetical protein
MKHYTKIIRYGFAVMLIGVTMMLSIAQAQQTEDSKPASTRPVYDSGRDPFRKYEPPRVVVKKIAGQILPPSIQERIAQYRAQKLAAMNARMPAPKPTTALLLSEMQVVGISRSPRGYAAIVEATPIKLSYVLYPGERFYDGQLVAIEDNRLVFRRDIVFSDGHRERSVEIKPLRTASPADAMTTAKATPAADSEKKPEEKAAAKP